MENSSINQFEENLEHLSDNNFLKKIINVIQKKSETLNMIKFLILIEKETEKIE